MYGAEKITLKNTFISAKFVKILISIESNWALWIGRIISERMTSNIEVGDFIDRLKESKKVAEPPITSEMIDAQG